LCLLCLLWFFRLCMELRIAEIMRILPHRYPFLLVDRVVEVDPDKRIVALKNVTINEPFFNGHFPGAPVMPGVLTIESMAQAGAILGLLEKKADLTKTLVYFMGIDEAKFRRPIVPGDQMRIVVEVLRRKAVVWKMKGEVYVGSELAAEATLLSSIGQQP
jgi:3-hydroxyacyl-[acyl-carrier-protein] dehydratase